MFVWTASDVMHGSVVITILLISLIVGVRRFLRQARCQHLDVNETSACEAICRNCGKNLGFIGTWRDKGRKP